MPAAPPVQSPRLISGLFAPAAVWKAWGVKKWLLVVVFAVMVWWWLQPAPAAAWSGRPAAAVPLQTDANLPAPWTRGEFRFQPLARFAVCAVVLSRERYRYDPEAKLAPVDLALGWGRMSEAAAINALRISQDHRWYNYAWWGEPPLPPAEIVRSSANMHLIPADDIVRAALLEVPRHEVVEFTGYLVEIRRTDGWTWRSSLSREDTGGHACEVVWVERLTHRKP